jgi:hypothetical protein
MIWIPGVMICSQAVLDRDALIRRQLDCSTLQMFSEPSLDPHASDLSDGIGQRRDRALL